LVHEIKKHGTDPNAVTGYAAVDGAREMLNEMMDDSNAKLDNEVEKCGTYNRETLVELEEIRQDVASFNAQAAEARGRVLKAQSTIAFCQMKMPQVEEELEQHNHECALQEASLNAQIGIVLDDIDVIGGILNIIGDCGDAPDKAGGEFIQCRHCRKGNEGFMMIQDNDLEPLINKLKSATAKSYVQQTLKGIYDESTGEEVPVALTQEQVRRQTVLMSQSQRAGLRRKQPINEEEMLESMGPGSDESMLNISEVPKATVPYDCVPTNKCTLGKGSCTKIRDRFLNIQAGILDLLTKLKEELAELQRSCEEDRVNMEAQIANLGEKLRGAQEDLAVATKDQVEAESSSNLKATQHAEITHEYGVTMKECLFKIIDTPLVGWGCCAFPSPTVRVCRLS
jgi:hypothetical protein